MKRSSILPAVVFVLFTGCASVPPAVRRTAGAEASEARVWTDGLRSDSLKNSYRVTLKTPDNRITGLCILKKSGDEWRGTLISEMGAKAFDFIVTDDQCTLLNVIPMMDKWYVKKTVADDLHYLFNVDNPNAPFRKRLERFVQDGCTVVNYGRKQIVAGPDGSIRLMNNRRNLHYELRKITEIDPDRIIM